MTSDRLPKILRTREAVARTDAHVPYWNENLDADYCEGDGEPWPCLAYRQATPPRCKCSHARVQHTAGEGQCWLSVCGCSSFRPQEAKQ